MESASHRLQIPALKRRGFPAKLNKPTLCVKMKFENLEDQYIISDIVKVLGKSYEQDTTARLPFKLAYPEADLGVVADAFLGWASLVKLKLWFEHWEIESISIEEYSTEVENHDDEGYYDVEEQHQEIVVRAKPNVLLKNFADEIDDYSDITVGINQLQDRVTISARDLGNSIMSYLIDVELFQEDYSYSQLPAAVDILQRQLTDALKSEHLDLFCLLIDRIEI